MKDTRLNLDSRSFDQATGDTLNLGGRNVFSGNTQHIITGGSQSLSIIDGNQQNGYVLKSDASGNVRWEQSVPAIKTFYVDGNNSETGDGSIINPFQTLEQARDAVIGSGTSSAPENEPITIEVAGTSYSTNQNLAIKNVTWDFADGTVLTYTGSDYLFNTSVFSDTTSSNLIVRGFAEFITATGGILYAEGTSSTLPSARIQINFEAFRIESNYVNNSNPLDKPPVVVTNPAPLSNNGRYGILLFLTIIQGYLRSSTQTTLFVANQARVYLNGISRPLIVKDTSTNNGNIIDFVGYSLQLRGFTLNGLSVDSYIKVGESGTTTLVNDIIIEDVDLDTTRTANSPTRFMTIYDVELNERNNSPDFQFVIRTLRSRYDNFKDQTTWIKYDGVNANFDLLRIYDSVIPYSIDPKIRIAKDLDKNSSSAYQFNSPEELQVWNVINGKFNISNLNTGLTGTSNVVIDSQGFLGIGGNAIYKEIITGDNSTTIFNINHNIGTRDVMVEVYENQSPYGTVLVSVERPTVNTVQLEFSVAPAVNVDYRVLIIEV